MMIYKKLMSLVKSIWDTPSFFRLNQLKKKNSNVFETISRVRKEKLTYLTQSSLIDLAEVVLEIENKKIEGNIIETGCAFGGSSIVIASSKCKERKFYIYDIFGMIPSPTEHDGTDVHRRYEEIKKGKSQGIDGKLYYGYETNLINKVKENFDTCNLNLNLNNIKLVKGLYNDTLHISEPVAFTHIDCDWYKSIKVCLERIEPHLVTGGHMVIDDYFTWSGCKKAVDEYFENKKDNYSFVSKKALHIIKNS